MMEIGDIVIYLVLFYIFLAYLTIFSLIFFYEPRCGSSLWKSSLLESAWKTSTLLRLLQITTFTTDDYDTIFKFKRLGNLVWVTFVTSISGVFCGLLCLRFVETAIIDDVRLVDKIIVVTILGITVSLTLLVLFYGNRFCQKPIN
jgi:hypothetical protein